MPIDIDNEELVEAIADDLEVRVKRELGVTMELVLEGKTGDARSEEIAAMTLAALVVARVGIEAVMVLAKTTGVAELTPRQACLVMSDLWLDDDEERDSFGDVVRRAQINAAKIYAPVENKK